MSHYTQSLVVEASPAAIYAALTTPEGLRGWWTEECDVATEVGGTIRFHFACSRKDMKVEGLERNREVRWLCTGAYIAAGEFAHKGEWAGTRIVFRLTPIAEGRTRIDFEHVGLVPALECYSLCSSGWQYFLSSLQQFIETGRGTPHRLAVAAAA